MLTGKLFLALLQRHGRMPLQKGLEVLMISLCLVMMGLFIVNTLVFIVLCLLVGDTPHPIYNIVLILCTMLVHYDEFAMHSKLSKAFKKGMPDD